MASDCLTVEGEDSAAIQAAVDRAAAEGGGKVVIPAGVYTMHDSLHLRSGVHVEGAGRETVLRKAAEVRSALSADLGYGHYDVSVAEPDKFRVGMGVLVADDRAGGFYQTVATLSWRDGDRFGTSRMLNHDYARRENGFVAAVFPVVSADGAEDASVSNLAIDGNRDVNPTWLNGCRGGGVFLIQTRNVALRGLHVSNLNADGISFQQTVGTVIEDCVCEDNVGHGLHPGSGSVGAVMRRCACRRNGNDGIFYCLRVSYSLCEECTVEGNGRHGISIGGRDTDHLIRRNTVRGNGREGIYFRPADAVMAAHRNVLEANHLAGNCRSDGDAEIHVAAPVRDVYLLGNRIEPSSDAVAAIRVADGAAVHHEAPDPPLPVGPAHAPRDAARHLARSQRAGADEVAWYARHAPTVRAAHRLLLEVNGELGGALTTSWALRYRDEPHYTVVKWMLEDMDLLPTLRGLHGDLPADAETGRLARLRQAVGECLEFVAEHYVVRDDYSDVPTLEQFRTRLGSAADALDALREAVEQAVLPASPTA